MNRTHIALLALLLGSLSAVPASADSVYFERVGAESECSDPVLGSPLLVGCSHSATVTNDGRATIHLSASPAVPGTAGAGEAYGDVSFGTTYVLEQPADELRITMVVSISDASAEVSGALTDTVGPAGSHAWVRTQFGAEHYECACVGEPEHNVALVVRDYGDGTYFPFRVEDDGIPKTRSNVELVYELVVRDHVNRPMPPGGVSIYFWLDAVAYLGGFGGIDSGSAHASVDLAITSLTIQPT